jgi:protein involved in polysaccharide export with SLBB domain
MTRPSTPWRRALALFLASQPVLWMSNVALAQTLEQQAMEGLRRDEERQQKSALPGEQGYGIQQRSGPTAQGPFSSPMTSPEAEAGRGERPASVQPAGGSTPVDEPVDPERYVLGPGDVLELHFWGIENFRLRVTVGLEGNAFVPKVGYLALQGSTLAQAQRSLQQTVARYFPKLNFGLNLAEPRIFLVQVADVVVRPGPQQAKAIDRVSAVIARAGGFAPGASTRRVEIRRRDGTVTRADLLAYAHTGDVKHNPFVLDGDVVRVPFEQLAATIRGAVNRPGRYELVGTCDLEELVGLAGGLAPTATRELPVIMMRRGPQEHFVQKLLVYPPSGGLPPEVVQQEDSFYFPSLTELQRSVTVVGAFAGVASAEDPQSTRRLPFAKGETVRTLLERVGGVGPLAALRRAYVARSGQAMPVDLYALVMLRDPSADRSLELGDTLVVPFTRRNILVEGAVFRPGSYQFNPTYGVEQYVALAGGLNRYAEGMEDVYVINPDGQKANFSPDLKVEPGSSLVVPERSFSRSEVVSIILAAAGILLSATSIFLAARK